MSPKQKVFKDEEFGAVAFHAQYDDGRFGYYASFPFLTSDPIEVNFYAQSDAEDDLRQVLNEGHKLLQREEFIGEALSHYFKNSILDSLSSVPAFQSRWAEEQGIEECWTLDGIDIDQDGDVRIFYEPDPDLQFEYGLQISLDTQGKIQEHEFIE